MAVPVSIHNGTDCVSMIRDQGNVVAFFVIIIMKRNC